MISTNIGLLLMDEQIQITTDLSNVAVFVKILQFVSDKAFVRLLHAIEVSIS